MLHVSGLALCPSLGSPVWAWGLLLQLFEGLGFRGLRFPAPCGDSKDQTFPKLILRHQTKT